MGGDGSGRKVGTEKRVSNLLGTNQPADTDNAVVYLPNYSGIKDSVRKDFRSGWTAGSVVFIGSTGDFTQDNSNFLWDDTNNRLGIGTASPNQKLQVVGGTFGVFNSATTGGFSVDGNAQTGMTSIYSDYLGGSEPKLHLSSYSGRATVGGITIDTVGNVGIGTTTPSMKLDVLSAGNFHAIRGTAVTTGYWGGLFYNSQTPAIEVALGGDTYAATFVGGNVGIGTTSPDVELDVEGSHVSGLGVVRFLSSNDAFVVVDAGSGNTGVRFKEAGTDKWIIYNNGADDKFMIDADGAGTAGTFVISGTNVGIGTTSPATALQVNGAITAAVGSAATPSFKFAGINSGIYSSSGNRLNIAINGVNQWRFDTNSLSPEGTTQILYINDGTATAPGITFNADSNTGLTRLGDDIVSLATAGVSRITAIANGNVGIGTTSPDSKLHISGGSLVYSKTTAPTLVTGSGAVFISGGTGGTVEFWLSGPTTQTRLGTVS